MKVVRLQIRNFMGLREIDIKTGKVNVVNGKNRQGKTSLIRAIEAAFQGGDQSAKVRKGESSAEIMVELDELYVQRNIHASGKTQLTVASKEGEIIKSPQTFLNGVVGGFSFNPAEFFLLDSKKQIEYLLESFPVKVSQEEVIRWVGGEWPKEFSPELLQLHGLIVVQKLQKNYYDQRTVVNRDLDKKAKAGQEQRKLVPADFDMEEYDPAALPKLYEQLQAAERNNSRMATLESDIGRLDEEIAGLERQLRMKRENQMAKQAELAGLTVVDTEELKTQLTKIDSMRQNVLAAEKLIELREEYRTLSEEAEKLNKIVETLSNEAPAELMKRLTLPVEGMTIEDEVRFNGKPFEQLSGAEQVQVSLALAKALNGKLKLVCVDGVEKFDDETFKLFMAWMEKDPETQFFLTQVGSRGGEEAVTIENGKVKSKEKAA